MITKPRSDWKPKSQWAKRVKGRIFSDILVESKSGPPEKKAFVFEMTEKGLSVRKVKSRKSTAKLWTFTQLANGAGASGQMTLL